MPYLLDTDHLSLLQQQSEAGERLAARLDRLAPDDVSTSIVSFQEQVQGWMAFLNKAKNAEQTVLAYEKLEGVLRSFRKMIVLPFDHGAQRLFEQFKKQKTRLPTLDLRIACVALATGSVLLSRNLRDFRKVPGLSVEDWTV
jgi:tRNA(fMet)-specific endonuclease VapC